MPKLAANLTLLWPELDLPGRIAAAAAAGFAGVEILFPYDDPAQEMRDALVRAGLELALINGPPPNYTGGARGFAAVPEAAARFRHDFRRVRRYAETLGASTVHLMAGSADGPEARAVYVENLAWAAAEAPELRLTIEPICREEIPGYFLADYDLALEVLAHIDAPNLKLQFDTYHASRITGDVTGTLAKVAPRLGHVQIGDLPGRIDPMQGELDWPAIFSGLAAAGYDGWIAGEYNPKGATEDGLGWMALA